MQIEDIRTVEEFIAALQKMPPKAGLIVTCWDGADTVHIELEKDYDDVVRVWIRG